MCIAIKTFRCGAKEHLFHTDCKKENCTEYVSYVAAPGDCFHCVTRHDSKILDKARTKHYTNSAMKLYAVALENESKQQKIKKQSDQINAGQRDENEQSNTYLDKAQGAVPDLLDQVRKLFPGFDNAALAETSTEMNVDVEMVDGSAGAEPPAELPSPTAGTVKMEQDPEGGTTVGPGKGESTPAKPGSRMTRSSSQKSQALQARSPNISNPSSPRSSIKRVAKGSPDQDSRMRKSSKGHETSKPGPGRHRKSLSTEEKKAQEMDSKTAETEKENE